MGKEKPIKNIRQIKAGIKLLNNRSGEVFEVLARVYNEVQIQCIDCHTHYDLEYPLLKERYSIL